MNTNPAYVEWVVMTKDGEEKLVHPGNVKAHETVGWVRKVSAEQSVSAETPQPESPAVVEPKVPEKKPRGTGRKTKGEDQPTEEK